MPVRPHRKGYQVTVERAAALPGFRRIRKNVRTYEEGKALEAEIIAAIETYGRWPVEPDAEPLAVPIEEGQWGGDTADYRNPKHPTGTFRQAMLIALDTHWKGMRSARSVAYNLYAMVHFMERRGKKDLDQITSADLRAYREVLDSRSLSSSAIKAIFSHFRVVNRIAMEERPVPLAREMIPTPSIKLMRPKKWWLTPENHEKVSEFLRRPGGDPLFADLIDFICHQGLRVEEALRMEPTMFTGLGTSKPSILTPGTKTAKAENAIPLYPDAVPIVERSIARARENRWKLLWPLTYRQARDRWDIVREFLGVEDIPTATLRALRRTFAWYANSRGMPTATLQTVMRHKDIKTTSQYLELIGSGEAEQSRKYFEKDSAPLPSASNVGAIIQAYASTPGVTPEDVARFAKELMI